MQAPRTSRPLAISLPAHLPTLDGVRAIAVLTVMVMHFTIMKPGGPVEAVLVNTISGGWAGVDLFFVLSGFLITGILVDAKGSEHYFRNFFVRRALRIFPLYYAYLTLLFVLLPILIPRTAAEYSGFENGIWVWTYLSNVQFARGGWEAMPYHTTHLWSLAVEEQFYLVWPFVVFLLSRRALVRVCLGAIGFATLSRIGLHYVAPDGIAGYALLPARIDALAMGGLLAMLVREPGGLATLSRYARPVMLGSGGVLVGMALWNAIMHRGDGYFPALALRVQLIAYPAFAVFFGAALILAVTVKPGGPAFRLLTAKPMMSIGRYSYALYLLHVPLRDLIRDRVGDRIPVVMGSRLPAQLALIVGAIGVSYVAAFVSWHSFEKHFLSLKRFFEYGDAARARPVPQPAAVPVTAARASHEATPVAGD